MPSFSQYQNMKHLNVAEYRMPMHSTGFWPISASIMISICHHFPLPVNASAHASPR